MSGHQERLGFGSVDPVGVGRFRHEEYLFFCLFRKIQDSAAVEQASTAADDGWSGRGKREEANLVCLYANCCRSAM